MHARLDQTRQNSNNARKSKCAKSKVGLTVNHACVFIHTRGAPKIISHNYVLAISRDFLIALFPNRYASKGTAV